MSKLAYVVENINQYVNVQFEKDKAALLRVKQNKKGKRFFNPVLFQKVQPEGNAPFWVEVPHIRPWNQKAFDKASAELRLKALEHLND